MGAGAKTAIAGPRFCLMENITSIWRRVFLAENDADAILVGSLDSNEKHLVLKSSANAPMLNQATSCFTGTRHCLLSDST